MSIAGKREGLAGERSGLFINAINIVRQMRMSTGWRQPRFFIWENVPGAFTSGSERGADFIAVLEIIAETDIPMPKDGRWAAAGMVQCPKCEIAWRTLDAQFWGVPQRRKRIFLVADFAATDRRAGKILFVEPSLSGNTKQSRETRKRVASTIEKSIRTASELVHRGGTFDIRISSDGTHNWRAHCYETERCRSLDTHAPDPDTNHGDVNLEHQNAQVVFSFDSLSSNSMKSSNPNSGCRQVEVAKTLDTSTQDPSKNQGGVTILEDVNLSTVGGGQNERTIYDMTHAQDVIRENKQAPTLNARMGTGGNQVPMAVDFRSSKEADINGTLQSRASNNVDSNNVVRQQYAVRRLTPLECERLQGLPDGWTLINDKSCSDSARYKAIGNGMAQPCADYVIQRIVDEVGKTYV